MSDHADQMPTPDDDRWAEKNVRRVALIDKELSEPLPPAEKAELEALQQEADRRLHQVCDFSTAGVEQLLAQHGIEVPPAVAQ